jgi:hypothetical protein
MKSIVFKSLFVLLLSFASASAVKAQSERISPFNLAHLARQGYFREQGIPSYSALCAAVLARRVKAEDLVKAAIAQNRLSSEMIDDESYLKRLEVILRRSCQQT